MPEIPNSNILPVVNLSTFDVRDERTLNGNKTRIETGNYVGGLSPEEIKIGDEFFLPIGGYFNSINEIPDNIAKQLQEKAKKRVRQQDLDRKLDRRAKAAKETEKDLAI